MATLEDSQHPLDAGGVVYDRRKSAENNHTQPYPRAVANSASVPQGLHPPTTQQSPQTTQASQDEQFRIPPSNPTTPPRSGLRKWGGRLAMVVFAGAVVAGVIAAAQLDAFKAGDEPAAREPGQTRVRVAIVEHAKASRRFLFGGMVRPSRQSMLSFTVPGRVSTRLVSVGDHVDEGTRLFELDPAPFINAVLSAKAAAKQAGVRLAHKRRQRKRTRRLAKDAAVATTQLEDANFSTQASSKQRQRAGIDVKEAERQLREATLIAPYAGTISAVHIEVGEYAQPGKQVVSLSDDNLLQLEVEVPEGIATAVSVGDEVPIVFPLLRHRAGLEQTLTDQEVTGHISGIGRVAVGQGRLFPVIVDLEPAPGIQAGMTAELVLSVPVNAEVSVPIESVINIGDKKAAVYRVRDGTAERVPVEVLEVVGLRATVAGPLELGESVVLGGQASLVDGQTVETLP